MVANKTNDPTFHKFKISEINGRREKTKIYDSTIDLVITNDAINKTLINIESLTISAAIDDELLWFHTPVLCTFETKLKKKKNPGRSTHRIFTIALSGASSWPIPTIRVKISPMGPTLIFHQQVKKSLKRFMKQLKNLSQCPKRIERAPKIYRVRSLNV